MKYPQDLRSFRKGKHWVSPVLLLVLFGLMLWFGGSRVLAADLPLDINQTIPSPPTATPTVPPPTPTPRPPTPGPSPTQRPPAPSPTPLPNSSNQSGQGNPSPTPVQGSGETASVPGAPVTAPSSPLTAAITAPTLNVRQGPGTTFAVIGRLTSGAQVTVLARNADGTWLNICCLPGTQTSGWISAQFVTPGYTTGQLTALPVGDGTTLIAGIRSTATLTSSVAVTGVVSVPSLNARSEPSTGATILGRFTSGAQVTVLGRNSAGNWWLVCCLSGDASNAWVAAGFVSSSATNATRSALPVVTGRNTPGAAVVTGATTVAPPAPVQAEAPAAATDAELVLGGPQTLLAAMQGEQVVLSFTVTNPSAASANQAEFSFEIPAGLTFVSASASDGGEAIQADTASGASLIIVTWPELLAGDGATVRITTIVDRELANGTVIDAAAVALAGNAASTFVPVSVGMPPLAPPDFQ